MNIKFKPVKWWHVLGGCLSGIYIGLISTISVISYLESSKNYENLQLDLKTLHYNLNDVSSALNLLREHHLSNPIESKEEYAEVLKLYELALENFLKKDSIKVVEKIESIEGRLRYMEDIWMGVIK